MLRNKRSNSMPISSTNTCSSANSKIMSKKAKILNPMELLIEAANSMNPKQFELPRSMSVPCLFPGTDKGEMKYSTGYSFAFEDIFFQQNYHIQKLVGKIIKLEIMKKAPVV